MKLSFFAAGIPATAGSKRPFVVSGKAVMADSSGERGRSWRTVVQDSAKEAMDGMELITRPVRLTVTFHFPRPKSHYGTGRNAHRLKDSAPTYHSKKPDLTKLVRAVEDAMNGVVWTDDSRVIAQFAVKKYSCESAGAQITVDLGDE